MKLRTKIYILLSEVFDDIADYFWRKYMESLNE